ncbi:MAG: radical SAM protein [Elusimicrobia bacterium]|nr:radical SAM protein [Elusimicrobiota bacterium]
MNQPGLDIALVQPPGWANQNPPLGLAQLKSYLTGQGLRARTFDLNIILYNLRGSSYSDTWAPANGYNSWESPSFMEGMFAYYADELLASVQSILAQNPRAVGLSTHCSSLLAARLLAAKFRQVAPEIRLVFGGPQVAPYTRAWRELLREGLADAVVFGEGEAALTEWLAADAGEPRPIAGVAQRGEDGKPVAGPSRELISPLDSLPFPDFSDFELDLYAGHNVLPTYFSRGCINHCCYCTENQFFPKFRCRTGARVLAEIRHQLQLHPRTEFFRIHDSVSNGNIRELESFCDLLIASGLKVGFDLENAVIRREMDDRLHRKLKRAGCSLIGYGLETPAKTLLRSVGKNACLDADFEAVVVSGAKAGITVGLNMMFGLPGETEADFQEQLSFIRKLRRHRRRLLINPALNFCYFPEGSAVMADPDRFGVDVSLGELFWSSKDGRNTFPDRLRKFEAFCAEAEALGYANLFGITKTLNRNLLLGRYHRALGDEGAALGLLEESFRSELKTLELAREILELRTRLGGEPGEVGRAAESFLCAQEAAGPAWKELAPDRGALDQFVLDRSLAAHLQRWSAMVRSTQKPLLPPPGPPWRDLGTRVRRLVLRLFDRISFAHDRRLVVILLALQELDNKLSAVAATKKRPL